MIGISEKNVVFDYMNAKGVSSGLVCSRPGVNIFERRFKAITLTRFASAAEGSNPGPPTGAQRTHEKPPKLKLIT